MKRLAAVALLGIAVSLPAWGQRGGGARGGGASGHGMSMSGGGSSMGSRPSFMGGGTTMHSAYPGGVQGMRSYSPAPQYRSSQNLGSQYASSYHPAPYNPSSSHSAPYHPGPYHYHRTTTTTTTTTFTLNAVQTRPPYLASPYGYGFPYGASYFGSSFDSGPAYGGGRAYAQPAYAQPAYAGNDSGAYAAPVAQNTVDDSYRPAYSPAQVPPGNEDAVTLIFNDGRPAQEIHNYILTRTTLYVQDGRRREVAVADLDLAATEKVNRAAGVDFQLPTAYK